MVYIDFQLEITIHIPNKFKFLNNITVKISLINIHFKSIKYEENNSKKFCLNFKNFLISSPIT
jgi:hypothetical protein